MQVAVTFGTLGVDCYTPHLYVNLRAAQGTPGDLAESGHLWRANVALLGRSGLRSLFFLFILIAALFIFPVHKTSLVVSSRVLTVIP
jgi:hypothetical protein